MSTYSYSATVVGVAGAWDCNFTNDTYSHELDDYQRANLNKIKDYIGDLFEARALDGSYALAVTSHGAAFDDDTQELVSRGRIDIVLDPTGDYGTVAEDLDAATADLSIEDDEADAVAVEEHIAA